MANRNTTPRPDRGASRTLPCALKTSGALVLCFLAACLPGRAAFLRVPVTPGPLQSGELLTVTADCAEIRKQIPGFEPSKASFYAGGRQALPFATHDPDGDGVPDQVSVTFACPASQSAWLVIVYPGAAPDAPASSTQSGRRVSLDFTRARR